MLVFEFISTSLLTGQNAATIRGFIKNAQGMGIADVSVFVSPPHQKKHILSACISGEDGCYELSVTSQSDTIQINLSGFNIVPLCVLSANKTQHKDFVVQEQTQELATAVVKAQRVYSQGDTINYNVASFQSATDMSIGQVLKRLPGITVSEEGQISFQGQPIKKFYIEGLDLLKGRYGIATNNLAPNNISTVQILENHQDIKALRNLKPEERASINLKLKSGAKGVFNLIATLGGCYDGAKRWDNELVGTCFRRKDQLLTTYKGNNSGNDLETEIRSFDGSGISRTSVLTDILMPSTPSIGKKYYYFNQSHSATYNNIYRIGKDGELGFNAAYMSDIDRRSNQSESRTLLPGGAENLVHERFKGKLLRDIAYVDATYKLNSDTHYVNESLKFDYAASSGQSSIQAGKNVLQNNTNTNYRIHNLLHITSRSRKDGGVEFLSRINVERRPHTLTVHPNLFSGILPGEEAHQRVERKNFSTENRLDFLSAMVCGVIQIHPRFFADFSHNNLSSVLATERNGISLDLLNTGIGSLVSCKFNKSYTELNLSIGYRLTQLHDKLKKIKNRQERILPDLRILFLYHIDGRNELKLNGTLNYSNPTIENLYDKPIMSSYRQLSSYEHSEPHSSRLQQLALSHSFKDIAHMWFADVNINWIHSRPNVLYGSSYDGLLERITNRQSDKASDVLSTTVRTSKAFDWKRMKIGAEYTYTYYESPILIQNTVSNYYGSKQNARMDINFVPFRWMEFSYDGTYYQSKTKLQGTRKLPILRTLRNNASVQFSVSNGLSLHVAIAHYYNNRNRASTSFLLGESGLNYSYKKCSINLTCDNIFNKKNYVYSNTNEVTEGSFTYPIRSRSVLLKLRYRIF